MERLDGSYMSLSEGPRGHFRCDNILPVAIAVGAAKELANGDQWGLSFFDGSRRKGVAPDQYASAGAQELSSYYAIAYDAAKRGFAYVREEWWPLLESDGFRDLVPQGFAPQGSGLAQLLGLLHGETFASWLQCTLRRSSLRLIRLGVERYKRGSFCAFTKGPPRDAEFGFSIELTEGWRSEWGGLAEFCDFSGARIHAHVPRFNSITLFRLDISRGISVVTPFCCEARCSVVGYIGTVARAE